MISSRTKRSTPRPADSAERAYKSIRDLAIEFRLRPDERINEVQLSKQLHVSRTPIREALNRLASEGFLVFQPNRGFFFSAPDMNDLLKLFELRSVIETGSFNLSCERATEAEIADLEIFWQGALARYDDYDPDEILKLDEEFHVRLARLAGNHEISRALDALNARIRFARRIQIGRRRHITRMTMEHGQMIEALKDRNSTGGNEALRSHISLTIEDASDVIKEAVFRLYMRQNTFPGSHDEETSVT
ncbi:DNA-binding GntR family transcriptional regulator [Rhodoligotrophos appendicifer]|uniref:GntR family transcriptional regulator n=1 Tax=Rhodoligotrophos appendicifer TaxID=987056 RepID=UPI001186A9AE|nr:GntR family transcriptional regulator [Rhodoligotrophos appendicifer]